MTPQSGPPPSGWDRRDYREWRREQRRQHYSEKNEKREKNEKNEKGRGGSITGPIVGALILIWLGISFYLQEIGVFPSGDWWAFFIAGIGIIIIIQGVVRYLEYGGPYFGSVIGGAVLFIIGLSFINNFWGNLWPLILVVIGVALLVSAFRGRRNRPVPTGSPQT